MAEIKIESTKTDRVPKQPKRTLPDPPESYKTDRIPKSIKTQEKDKKRPIPGRKLGPFNPYGPTQIIENGKKMK